MITIQRIFIVGVAALTLLLTGCTGDYYVGGPGPLVGGFVPFGGGGRSWGGHHFYGRSFGSRHFASAHGGGHAGFHGGGGHGGGHR
jgi:hypothetical protein